MAINPNTNFPASSVLTADQQNRFPRGVMAYNEITTPVTSITTEKLIITGSSFTAVANRYYKVTFYIPLGDGSDVTGYVGGRIRSTNVSGTLRQAAYLNPKYTGSTTNWFFVVQWVGTLSAGTQNFVGSLDSQSGTARIYADSTTKPFLLVEDIGPA